ncbi:peptide deformylase [Saccharothrix xinjiangensis]|uniref:Peptide deformylase n=1 Tax=Saccharothrix xinjiangensis TaxID=204798 RepID=A0ABV9YB59_9PSEU
MTGGARSTGGDSGETNAFAAELTRWRDVRSLSRTALAKLMGYDRSYVSKVESGHERPSREFALHADAALKSGGALRTAFREFEAGRTGKSRPPLPFPTDQSAAGSLVVDHDDATLHYDGHTYRLTQRRHLVNGGTEPITRYLIRISVDRYPGDPERSNRLYSENPLTWDEIGLHAWHGQDRSEPMGWSAHHDRDAFKEVWLHFAGDTGHFPLYPGESTWIEYEYTVRDEHWGNWFQRAIRLPTAKLSVSLNFPADLTPVVWGLHTSMTAEAMPFPTAIDRTIDHDRVIFAWSCQDPPLHARYRLEWDFRSRTTTDTTPARPSKTMAALGVVQDGDPLLRRTARPFDLPAEAEDARRVITELHSAAERIAHAHTFGKGMGIAAPQIGIDRAAALVRPPGTDQPITLLNPTVIENGTEIDEQYEGCLSFFDVRCLIPRPMQIHVEHTDITGKKKITVFDRGMARLVAHEVDHLHGTLCHDHLPEGRHPIPIEQYRGTGQTWNYSGSS